MIPKLKFVFSGIDEIFDVLWHFINSDNKIIGKRYFLKIFPQDINPKI